LLIRNLLREDFPDRIGHDAIVAGAVMAWACAWAAISAWCSTEKKLGGRRVLMRMRRRLWRSAGLFLASMFQGCGILLETFFSGFVSWCLDGKKLFRWLYGFYETGTVSSLL
jgi:hypothetical protein